MAMTDKTTDNSNPDDSADFPTWVGEIKGFFSQQEIGCMRKAKSDYGSYKMDLGSYDVVKEKYVNIHRQVESGRMPMGARRWSPAKVARFEKWKEGGFKHGGEGVSDDQ